MSQEMRDLGVSHFEGSAKSLEYWTEIAERNQLRLSEGQMAWIRTQCKEADIVRFDKTSPETQRILIDYLMQNDLLATEFGTELFWKRVELCERLLGSHVINKEHIKQEDVNAIHAFVTVRSSFLDALRIKASMEGLLSLTNETETIHSFVKTAEASDLEAISDVTPELLIGWKRRERLPIDCHDDGLNEDGMKEGLAEVLKISGMDQVAIRCIGSIEARAAEGAAAGEHDPNTHEIFIYRGRVGFRTRIGGSHIPETLFHEVGHAFHAALRALPEGQSLVDRYAVEAVYSGPHVASEFPEAVALMEGRETQLYVKESYAEDFRTLIEYPILIPEGRRAILEDTWRKVFPDIPLEEIQSKTRQMYGNLYGKAVSDIQRPASCKNTRKFAHLYDRVMSEGAREEGVSEE